MKYIKQFGIILTITCIGEIIKTFVPLPIPGSIYGLILLFVLLMTGILKLEQVKDTGKFLIEIMPLMFIPAAVGLLNSWEQLSSMVVPVCVIIVVSTFLVMIVTGKATDLFIDVFGEKNSEKENGKEGEAE